MFQELSSPICVGPLAPGMADPECAPSDKHRFLFTTSTGHLVVYGSSPWRCCAVAIHSSHLPCLASTHVCSHPSAVLRTPAGIFSFTAAHLPAAHYPTEVFLEACSSLHEVLARHKVRCRLVVGMDANVQFAPNSSEAVGGLTSCTSTPGLRERTLSSLALSLGLRFQNTFTSPDSDYLTHKPWNGSRRSQIDYILLPVESEHAPCFTLDLPVQSDHRAVYTSIHVGAREKFVFRPSPKNWRLPAKPCVTPDASKYDNDVSSHTMYNDDIMLQLCAQESGPFAAAATPMGTSPPGLVPMEGIANAIASSAKVHGFSAHFTFPNPFKAELRNLERQRRVSFDPDVRKELMKRIWQLRRTQKRMRADAHLDFCTRRGARQWRQSQRPQAATRLDENEDRSSWPAQIGDFFRGIFTNGSPELSVWRTHTWNLVMQRAANFRAAPELSIVFTVDDVECAINKMKRGKTTADDHLSSEMLQSLDRHCMLFLACAFSARASGDSSEVMAWNHMEAVLLPKVPRVTRTADLRPITILPTLKKLYSNLLLSHVRPCLQASLSP